MGLQSYLDLQMIRTLSLLLSMFIRELGDWGDIYT